MTQLKPCPFCGSKNIAKVLLPGVKWITGCIDCGCRTSEHIRSSEAVKSWNTRPDPAEQGNMPVLCEETPF